MTNWLASWARRRTTSLWVPARTAAMAGKISPCAARRRSTNTWSKAEPAARCISFSQPCCSKVGRSGRRTPTSAAASRVRLSRTTCWAAISRPAARTRGSTPFEAAIIPACISQRPARRTRTTKSRSAAESGAALPLPTGLSGTSTPPGPGAAQAVTAVVGRRHRRRQEEQREDQRQPGGQPGRRRTAGPGHGAIASGRILPGVATASPGAFPRPPDRGTTCGTGGSGARPTLARGPAPVNTGGNSFRRLDRFLTTDWRPLPGKAFLT